MPPMMDQVAALREFFKPPSEAPLPMQVAMMNQQMGANGDRRKTMDGEVVNFYVHYEIDGDTSKHVLKLDDYGGNDENSWVLLEVAETDDTNTTG